MKRYYTCRDTETSGGVVDKQGRQEEKALDVHRTKRGRCFLLCVGKPRERSARCARTPKGISVRWAKTPRVRELSSYHHISEKIV